METAKKHKYRVYNIDTGRTLAEMYAMNEIHALYSVPGGYSGARVVVDYEGRPALMCPPSVFRAARVTSAPPP